MKKITKKTAKTLAMLKAGKPLPIGEAVLTFTADTSDIDREMSQLLSRIERSVAAFRAAWFRK